MGEGRSVSEWIGPAHFSVVFFFVFVVANKLTTIFQNTYGELGKMKRVPPKSQAASCYLRNNVNRKQT